MSDPIETICVLASCSREIAEESYAKTQSIVDSVDELLMVPPKKYALPSVEKTTKTPEQIELERIRSVLENAEREIQEKIKHKTLTGSNPLESSEPAETTDRREETVLQSSCVQECQLPVLE